MKETISVKKGCPLTGVIINENKKGNLKNHRDEHGRKIEFLYTFKRSKF